MVVKERADAITMARTKPSEQQHEVLVKLRKRRAKRNSEFVPIAVLLDFNDLDHDGCEDTTKSTSLSKRDGVEKRWAKGDLRLDYANEIKIFEARVGCPDTAYSAKLRADLQIQMSMKARYAYYYSGAFISHTKPRIFFYFGVEPEAYRGLKLVGDARLSFASDIRGPKIDRTPRRLPVAQGGDYTSHTH
ncbi:hypothetical protein DL770_010781 [Monosporascus sp. CRB-9-2]|nr:hypothetical protein DL770_010781 [Monosporascus sp. CRB-9-2]